MELKKEAKKQLLEQRIGDALVAKERLELDLEVQNIVIEELSKKFNLLKIPPQNVGD